MVGLINAFQYRVIAGAIDVFMGYYKYHLLLTWKIRYFNKHILRIGIKSRVFYKLSIIIYSSSFTNLPRGFVVYHGALCHTIDATTCKAHKKSPMKV